MLAQSFKSANELDLTDKQFTALCRVLAFFEMEQVKTAKRSRSFDGIAEKGNWFHMGYWYNAYPGEECGTVGCIGGWAANLAGDYKLFTGIITADKCSGLEKLFFVTSALSRKITVEIAARGLRHYLTTGKVDWERAIANV